MTEQEGRKSIVWSEDPFSGPREVLLPGHVSLSPERMLEYVQALEQRCNALWAYLQGHEVAQDPIVSLIAEEYGITGVSESLVTPVAATPGD